MIIRNFMEMLKAGCAKGKQVCVGLDSEHTKIPGTIAKYMASDEAQYQFNRRIVEATADLALAYKPNIAFYEAMGERGLCALRKTISHINHVAPEVPVIIDAKRGDIGDTNNSYMQNAFGYLQADAITVNPYLGQEALQPFLNHSNKGIIVLCRTTNSGAGEFQDRLAELNPEEAKLMPKGLVVNLSGLSDDGPAMFRTSRFFARNYQIVAMRVAHFWNKNNNCALVAGATYPHEMQQIRSIVGDMPLLIPGIGKQGGDLAKTVSAGKDSKGEGMIINSSSAIIFASNCEDFAEAARRETLKLHDAITECLKKGAVTV